MTWPWKRRGYTYHVAYSFQNGNDAISIILRFPIRFESDVKLIAENIGEHLPPGSKGKVVITNWILLPGETQLPYPKDTQDAR